MSGQRTMYVRLTQSNYIIIDDVAGQAPTTYQTEFLEYARDNNIKSLVLYDLAAIIGSSKEDDLQAFMRRAKEDYCITKIGANVTCGSLVGYPQNANNTRPNEIVDFNTNPLNIVKFDALVSEFEFWNNTIRTKCVDCDEINYPNVFMDYYIPMLDYLKAIKTNPANYITFLDVYLQGKAEDPQIFDPNEVLNSFNVFQNANMIDNRADNIYITCYKNIDLTDTYYDSYSKFNKLVTVFGNNDPGNIAEPTTVFKPNTKISPLFSSQYYIDPTPLPEDDSKPFTGIYFQSDPNLSANKTPAEIEAELFNDPLLTSTIIGDNIINSGNVAWFKNTFMPMPSNSYITPNLYQANSILFSDNPVISCNKVTFDYTGPIEVGIGYEWNYGDGNTKTGTTSATNSLETTADNVHIYEADASGNFASSYNVSLTLTYPGGCTYTFNKKTPLVISGPVSKPVITATAVDGCNNGAALVNITTNSNLTPFTFVWTPLGQTSQTIYPVNTSTYTFNNLSSGSYTLQVTNSANCISTIVKGIANNSTVFKPNGYIVNGVENWTGISPLSLTGIVIINSGATLTINDCDVEFAYGPIAAALNDEGINYGARFQINHGGKLIINNNSTLTGCGGSTWDGIESRGPNSTNSNYIDAATLDISNSMISNAKIGFVNDRRRTTSTVVIGGGIINAKETIFKNNRLAVELKYNTTGSTFIKCDFIYDNTSPFLYPVTDVSSQWNPTVMTFVHLKNIASGVSFLGNTFNSSTSFSAQKRGTAIYSEYSKLNIDLFGSSPSIFKSLTYGINKLGNTGQLNIINSTFENVQYGIKISSGVSDVVKSNSFNSIPSATSAHTYGIYTLNSKGFNMTSNKFEGASSSNPVTAGSHGIIVQNSGSVGGMCYQNDFKGTDYGIHTQSSNPNLTIRCNHFATNNQDHNKAALYVYSGSLKMQGLSSCNLNVSHSAGNTWNGPNASTGKSITSFLTNPFKYYTQGSTAINYNNIDTYPFNYTISGVNVNNNNSMQCVTVNLNNNSEFCSSETLTLPIIDDEDWFTGIDSNFTFLESMKMKHIEIYENLKQWDDEKSIQMQAEELENIEWYVNEIQTYLNQVTQVFPLDVFNPELEKLLLKINTSEAYKMLADYYYSLKEFEKAKEQLNSVVDITKNEIQYSEGFIGGLKFLENDNFVKYMQIQIELASEEKQMLDLSKPQISQLESIVASDVQISGQAALDLFEITGIEYEFPVYKKEIDKSMEKSLSIKQLNSRDFTIYPNPSSTYVLMKYELPENSTQNFILVYNALGKLMKQIDITASDSQQIEINVQEFASGIYTCIFVSDFIKVHTGKLAIIK